MDSFSHCALFFAPTKRCVIDNYLSLTREVGVVCWGAWREVGGVCLCVQGVLLVGGLFIEVAEAD